MRVVRQHEDHKHLPTRELTVKSIVVGSLFGALYGSATIYLALKAGLTVSAAIPIAVLSVSVLNRIGKATTPENNIVQTMGSIAEAIAAGIAFTVPGFLFLHQPQYFTFSVAFCVAVLGGSLGVALMSPLRTYFLTTKEREGVTLPFPEATACARVLTDATGHSKASKLLFNAVCTAVIFRSLSAIGGLFRDTVSFATGPGSALRNATLSVGLFPEYLGVGYYLRFQSGAMMLAGGVVSWLVLIPLLSMFVSDDNAVDVLRKLNYSEEWLKTTSLAQHYHFAYVRYIGAGAIATAGLLRLIETLPSIYSNVKKSLAEFSHGLREAKLPGHYDVQRRYVTLALVVIFILIIILPGLPTGPAYVAVTVGVSTIVFAGFFSLVSARIVGLVGGTSNPVSAMTLASLILTALIFLLYRLGPGAMAPVALTVGCMVCVAAASSGATIQAFKVGELVGGTPVRQQVALAIGVVVAALAAAGMLLALHATVSGGIGGPNLHAPQAQLMATVSQGVLAGNLEWSYLFIGSMLAVMLRLCGVSPLLWAVGAYLPIATTVSIFIGGVARYFSERANQRDHGEDSETHLKTAAKNGEAPDVDTGEFYATGLIAGGALLGTVIALATVIGPTGALVFLNLGRVFRLTSAISDLIGVALFAFIAFRLFMNSRRVGNAL